MPLQNIYIDDNGLKVGNNQLTVSGNTVYISNTLVFGIGPSGPYNTNSGYNPGGSANFGPNQFGNNNIITLSANSPPPFWGSGAIDLRVGASGGRVGITFDSNVNGPSDFGYIYFYDDLPNYSAGTSERGTLLIGVQNDGLGGADDQIAIESSGNIMLNPGLVGGGQGGLSSWSQSLGNLFVGNNSVKYLVAHEGYTGAMTLRTSTLTVNGAINAITKSFEIDHPTKPGKRLRYGSLEGPENGVYVRGRLTGTNVIEMPDYWTGLVDDTTYTVNLTPIGSFQALYVVATENNQVTIGINGSAYSAIDCFYTVFAERKDVAKLVVEE
jgi:hypothetical protein